MRRILTWLSILTAAAFAQTSFSEDSLNVVANDPGGSFSAAWVDYNGDGNLDLFVANGDDFTSTPLNNFLYRNDGGGDFFPVTSGAIAADLTDTRGCSWGDYDNDGDPDLFVAVAFDDNSLYRNDGGDNFTKMTPSEVGSIVSDGGGSLGACWGDYDNDGDLDLFVANDSGYADLPCFLYENDGSGFFTRVLDGTAFPMVNAYGPHRSASWGDYDNDGYIDLFLARFGRNELYHNLGGSGFEKILSGDIVNVTSKPVQVPDIRFSLRNATRHEVYHWTGRAENGEVAPDGQTAFVTRLASPPLAADHLQIHFVDAGKRRLSGRL